jgi:hypothetical protein
VALPFTYLLNFLFVRSSLRTTTRDAHAHSRTQRRPRCWQPPWRSWGRTHSSSGAQPMALASCLAGAAGSCRSQPSRLPPSPDDRLGVCRPAALAVPLFQIRLIFGHAGSGSKPRLPKVAMAARCQY